MPPAPLSTYDPFARGGYTVGVRTDEAFDAARGRVFPCEIWYPADAAYAGQDLAPATQDSFTVPARAIHRTQMAVRDAQGLRGEWPLVIFSHGSGHWRRYMATFLCTHLASHGYLVAAMDHSETFAPELAPAKDETAAQRAARVQGWLDSRVPDIRFLVGHLDPSRVGIVGHSFGGWTALAAPEQEPRIRAVVALAPAGSSRPKPGIIPAKLTFAWGRDVPTLYLAAENDTMTVLDGMYELFGRTRATRQMVILRRADHAHFMDNAEEEHEAVRAMPFSGDLAWIPQEMRPVTELCSGEQAHTFVRGLTLCHMDAFLQEKAEARRFLAGDLVAELAARGVDGIVHKP